MTMNKRRQLQTMIRARVTEKQKRQMEAIAAANQLPVSAAVREAIREYLAEHFAQDRPEPGPDPSPPPPPPQPTPELARA